LLDGNRDYQEKRHAAEALKNIVISEVNLRNTFIGRIQNLISYIRFTFDEIDDLCDTLAVYYLLKFPIECIPPPIYSHGEIERFIKNSRHRF